MRLTEIQDQTRAHLNASLQPLGESWLENNNIHRESVNNRVQKLNEDIKKCEDRLVMLQTDANELTQKYEGHWLSIESSLDVKSLFQCILDQKLSDFYV